MRLFLSPFFHVYANSVIVTRKLPFRRSSGSLDSRASLKRARFRPRETFVRTTSFSLFAAYPHEQRSSCVYALRPSTKSFYRARRLHRNRFFRISSPVLYIRAVHDNGRRQENAARAGFENKNHL